MPQLLQQLGLCFSLIGFRSSGRPRRRVAQRPLPRTEAAKIPRSLNARVCPCAPRPSGRDAKFAAIGARENCANSVACEKRTESSKSGAAEKNRGKRMEFGRSAFPPSQRLLREMPAIPRVSYGIGSSGENACEDRLAVCAGTIEPCSGPNSLINRESAGNFRGKRARVSRFRALRCWNHIDFSKFPTLWNRELLEPCREFGEPSREFSRPGERPIYARWSPPTQ